MKPLDIAITGCGIAGLASAILLRRQRHTVTLYERFAEPKPIGSGLMIQPTGLAVLQSMGLAQEAAERGAPVDALLGLNTEGEPVLEASYGDLGMPEAVGLGIHRSNLFGILYKSAREAGATIQTGRDVQDTDIAGDGRILHFANGSASRPHDLVIDAAGLGSMLVPKPAAHLPFGALWATVDWPGEPFQPRILEQRYARADQMVGVLATGQGKAAFFWSLRADEYDAWQAAPLDLWKAQVCALWPECEAITAQLHTHDQLTFARYAHRTTRAPVGERIAHIGDAWHAASPQLGQGANMALLDAYALAKAIESSDTIAAALGQLLELRQSHVKLYQALTWGFTPPFQSSSIWPALFRDLFMAPGSRIGPFPRLKAITLSGLLGAPLETLGLDVPDYPSLAASASNTWARASSLAQS
ncbi:FAD-dependent oxidoreductase [Aurantiacibacter gangjinensis]|uniref:Glutamate synthase n=1 Tax=Aurantiacibacter gangjinensis TaxID=502682 RepID=A0A0G9MMW5_9SPHN|nr:NAD(P)/FAD-dependent oxidoreductase [Aurantiacibacter gangjinensis]APE28181.1 FAD-dependent oxidoreductase [Aurantiacibacter gangjinensis]KLE32086.1 glutamate synthase [Aurantiacibacter gangjinensis]